MTHTLGSRRSTSPAAKPALPRAWERKKSLPKIRASIAPPLSQMRQLPEV